MPVSTIERRDMATPDTEKQDVLDLLPWYLNGTLSDEETERVRNYIENSPELQSEADETDALLKVLGDDVPVPMLTHARIESVMERLDEKPSRANPVSKLIDRLTRRRGRSFFGSALPVALAAALALVAIVVIVPQQDSAEGVYETLYDDRPAVPIEVELANDLSSADAQALFEELSLEAVQQPGGTYRIELPKETSVGELYQMLQTLKTDERVADARALTDED